MNDKVRIIEFQFVTKDLREMWDSMAVIKLQFHEFISWNIRANTFSLDCFVARSVMVFFSSSVKWWWKVIIRHLRSRFLRSAQVVVWISCNANNSTSVENAFSVEVKLQLDYSQVNSAQQLLKNMLGRRLPGNGKIMSGSWLGERRCHYPRQCC